MTNLFTKVAMPLVFATLCIFPAGAQLESQATAQGGPPVLAKTLAPAKYGMGQLLVTSNRMSSGGALDDKYTQNGEGSSPPIIWTKGPKGTVSYVLLAEDAGVARPEPIVHWVVYNIPSNMSKLASGQPATATLPGGAMQGLNVRKTAGYLGPKPPAGQMHPYHFQVFALNRDIDIAPEKADRDSIVAAMKNHVLAMGDFVMNYTGK